MSDSERILKNAQNKTEEVLKKTNEKIAEMGIESGKIYQTLLEIQNLFTVIRNAPDDLKIQYEQAAEVCVNWKQQVDYIEASFEEAATESTGRGAVGVGAGVAVATLGPTAAMGVATTFGVASTGAAISSLSGAAATNAALAWLGGGTLAAGGGGMAAGSAFLALAGPAGWIIGGIAVLGAGLFYRKAKRKKERLEHIFTLISRRDTKSYELAIVEINERIKRLREEDQILKDAIEEIRTFGIYYDRMTREQHFKLGSYVNLMYSDVMLLVNPILGLQPKYTEEDYRKFAATKDEEWKGTSFLGEPMGDHAFSDSHEDEKAAIITLANLLYEIDLDSDDINLLDESLEKNEKFLQSVQLDTLGWTLYTARDCLEYKYAHP